jgi:hypothetical protein
MMIWLNVIEEEEEFCVTTHDKAQFIARAIDLFNYDTILQQLSVSSRILLKKSFNPSATTTAHHTIQNIIVI